MKWYNLLIVWVVSFLSFESIDLGGAFVLLSIVGLILFGASLGYLYAERLQWLKQQEKRHSKR